MTQKNLRDLNDGLILRRSTAADAEPLADFCGRVHSEDGPDKPDSHIAAWTRDLVAKPHPTFHADDFTVVAETATGRIVSALNMIPQTWTYEGIPFGVGRPELVGTLPEYRNRGLVRIQFDEIHKWSAERGDLVQGITGIPYFSGLNPLMAAYGPGAVEATVRAVPDYDKFLGAVLSELNHKRHIANMRTFLSGGPCNVLVVPATIRHIFAHGKLTPNSGVGHVRAASAISELVCAFLFRIIDGELLRRLRAHGVPV